MGVIGTNPGPKEAHKQTKFHNHSSRELEGDSMETDTGNYAKIERLFDEFKFYCPKYNPRISKVEDKELCCDCAANCAMSLADYVALTGDSAFMMDAAELSKSCEVKKCAVRQPVRNLTNSIAVMKEQYPNQFKPDETYVFQPFNPSSNFLSPQYVEIMDALALTTDESPHEHFCLTDPTQIRG